MFMRYRQNGMTLAEVLVTLAVILILFGTLSGLGIHLKRQSEIRLTESTLAVLVMALEQYYNDAGTFVPPVNSQADFDTAVGVAATQIRPPAVHWSGVIGQAAWSSEALYYFLNRSPNSKAIIETLLDRFLSNQDALGRVLLIEIPTGETPTDLIRFVDVWGMPIRYQYDPSVHAFPILTSAGPDKQFETVQDNMVYPPL